MAGWLQALVVLGLVGVLHVPLGDYLARVFTTTRHWRAETAIYRACGISPADDQPWTHYAATPPRSSPSPGPASCCCTCCCGSRARCRSPSATPA